MKGHSRLARGHKLSPVEIWSSAAAPSAHTPRTDNAGLAAMSGYQGWGHNGRVRRILCQVPRSPILPRGPLVVR